MKGPNDEFRELADVFDTMLEQLESHVTEQQRFAANASHELRTPLAISQTLPTSPATTPHGTRANSSNASTLSTRGRSTSPRPSCRSAAPTAGASPASPSTSPSSPKKPPKRCFTSPNNARSRSTSPARTQTVGSAALLLRMVTNLVQDAIVHNLPAGGTVTVHTEAQHDASVLRVANTGHPIPPELVPTLTEPFQRGTQRARTDDHAGVGLGLAIVHSIVRAHDGTLDLTPRPAGGLLITIRLPGTPQASGRSVGDLRSATGDSTRPIGRTAYSSIEQCQLEAVQGLTIAEHVDVDDLAVTDA